MKEEKRVNNLSSLRKSNILETIRLILCDGVTSRSAIAKRLGVSKMTITNIINLLMRNGYIEEVECEPEKTGSVTGPKPVALRMKPNKLIAIGVHIGQRNIEITVVDLAVGEVYQKKKWLDEVDTNSKLVYDIRKSLDGAMLYCQEEGYEPLGIGVTYHGAVDINQGYIYHQANTIDKKEIKIEQLLNKYFNLPVVVGTEIEGALMEEIAYGSIKSTDNAYYVYLSERVKGLMFANGAIRRGMSGNASELEHISIKYDGALCSCGNRGCYHLYAGMDKMLKDMDCITPREMSVKLEAREPIALRVMENFVQATSVLAANIINFYDPEYIVVGQLEDMIPVVYLKQIENRMNQYCMYKKMKYTKVVVGLTNEKSVRRGSAMLVFQRMFIGQLSI